MIIKIIIQGPEVQKSDLRVLIIKNSMRKKRSLLEKKSKKRRRKRAFEAEILRGGFAVYDNVRSVHILF